ncbi:MspA family porin [Gordonia sp. CPCC 205333]|uniref:MspA family porin n=1 Tax=Gordonia sp. CPCC 205333 TaxID=3140790 RepID=UPI003AF3F14D
MSRRLGVGLTATVAALVVASGVASITLAAPSSFANQTVSKRTDDGWLVTASKLNEKVRSVPPLDQSPWTREGYLSLKGTADIRGTGKVAVNSGALSVGFAVACNTDVTSGVTLGVTGGPTAQMSISYPPAVILGAQVMPNISTTLRPGTISDVSFGSKKLAAAHAGVELDGVHLKVSGCLGPVAVRAYVSVAISTPLNDNTIHVYGTPHYL